QLILCFFVCLCPARSTLFPYTTLFRSRESKVALHKTLDFRNPGVRWQTQTVHLVNRHDTQHAADQCEPLTRGQSRRRQAPFLHRDRKSTRLNSSHVKISYAVFCLKKKK